MHATRYGHLPYTDALMGMGRGLPQDYSAQVYGQVTSKRMVGDDPVFGIPAHYMRQLPFMQGIGDFMELRGLGMGDMSGGKGVIKLAVLGLAAYGALCATGVVKS